MAPGVAADQAPVVDSILFFEVSDQVIDAAGNTHSDLIEIENFIGDKTDFDAADFHKKIMTQESCGGQANFD